MIVLVSGGASALIPAPVANIRLGDKAEVTRLLLASGLDITQVNLVRQHLSRLKGGGFLSLASPASVTSYILSDVIGDDLRAVAGGPTVSPIGTHADARRTCIEAGFWHQMPLSVREFLDQSIPETNGSQHADNFLIGSNSSSLSAAQARAAQDFQTKTVSEELTGDVSEAAEKIVSAAMAESRERTTCLLFGGETTVRLTGSGMGGRNQELALRVALLAAERKLGGDWVFLSGGTDGRDGPTPAAGATVDKNTLSRMRASEVDPMKHLANNDSYSALAASDDLLETGATGTNVADVQVLLLTKVSKD